MKGKIFIAVAVLLVACALAGCGGIDKRLYGRWITEDQSLGYGFGMDKLGYSTFQGFSLPIVYDVKDGNLYILLSEEGDPLTDEEAMIYGLTFFGDNEIVLEYPVDSGQAVTYKRDTTQTTQ